jgi:3-hydroxyisobutyrate dehydrogenase-like beta-hydroxyacid dehydrogenase
MDIGFIGLGKMGSAMVRSLLRAGHRVVVYNRTASKATELREVGAQVAHTLGEVCRGDIVFTMVSDDAAVNDLVCRPHGLLDVLEPMKTVHVSSSTIGPALVHELAERHAERNLGFVSVPVLGRPDVAEAGKLTAIAAGTAAHVDVVRAALDAFAQKTFVVGRDPEAANVVKLACNAMIATIIEALGESLALVMKTGLVEPTMFIDVLLGTVLASPAFRPYGEHLRDHKFEPGFRLPLALKDMELALGTAHDFAVPLPIMSVIRDHMLEAIATGHGDQDWIALALVAQQAAGLNSRPGH